MNQLSQGESDPGIEELTREELATYNEDLVLQAIGEGHNTRKKIMKAKKMRRTTVWDTLSRLEKKGIIKKNIRNTHRHGRQPNIYAIIVE